MHEAREVMTSPVLREASVQMLEMAGGEWHKDDPIPMAYGEDDFTSFLSMFFKVFLYGWNMALL